jgi:hypothetical protein
MSLRETNFVLAQRAPTSSTLRLETASGDLVTARPWDRVKVPLLVRWCGRVFQFQFNSCHSRIHNFRELAPEDAATAVGSFEVHELE